MKTLLVFSLQDRWWVMLWLYTIIVVICQQESKTDRYKLHVYARWMIYFAFNGPGSFVFCGLECKLLNMFFFPISFHSRKFLITDILSSHTRIYVGLQLAFNTPDILNEN